MKYTGVLKMPPYFSVPTEGVECPECKSGFSAHMLRCSECGAFVHLSCSKLPDYLLVRLATTRASFACGSCVRVKTGEKWNEVLGEIKQLMDNESAGDDTTSLVGDTQAAEEASNLDEVPSAPPASQMPSTQEVALDNVLTGESWGAPSETLPVARCSSGRSTQAKPSATVNQGNNKAKARSNRHEAPNEANKGNSEPSEIIDCNRKRGICRYYKTGSCKYGQKGDGCNFLHPRKCFKYMRFGKDVQKGCRDNQCSFLHPPLCRLVEAGKICTREKCRYYHRSASKVKQTRRQMNWNKSGVQEARPPKSFVEAIRLGRRETEPPRLSERTQREITEVAPAASPSSAQLDFRLLQEQVTRMEQQIRQLLDVRNGSFRNQRCVCL